MISVLLDNDVQAPGSTTEPPPLHCQDHSQDTGRRYIRGGLVNQTLSGGQTEA